MATPLLFGPYGNKALKLAGQLPEFGVNAVWFHEFDGAAFELCEKNKLAACVEFKTFRADFNEHPELIPVGADGERIRYGRLVQGVCLSQQAFLEETERRFDKGLERFNPAGIWLDYLTYAGWFETPQPDLQESCFCRDCIADFCERAGVDAEQPEVILSRHASKWHRHKCERIARFAARYARMIRARLPECVVGAYMCPWRPDEFDGALTRIFAQDYDLLAPSIDVFTPLIYNKKCGRPPEWGREFLEASPRFIPSRRAVQLILDAQDFPASLQAVAKSRTPSRGLQVFGGAEIFADPDKAHAFRTEVERIRSTLERV
jgi:hypothetical protein